MSPEYAFPIPTSDSYAVTSYVFKNAHSFNGDPDKIILAGDSAGILTNFTLKCFFFFQ